MVWPVFKCRYSTFGHSLLLCMYLTRDAIKMQKQDCLENYSLAP